MTDKAMQEAYRDYLENEKLLRKTAEDKRLSTYLAHAVADSEDIGGRFKQVSPMTITGATPFPQYPRLPANSPWSQQWPKGEDVYGVPIDAQEPVGEQFEIEEAQRILDERSAALPADGEPVTDAPVTSLAVECVAGSPTNSSDVVGVGVSTTGEPLAEVLTSGSPTPSQSSAALRTTLTTRGSASNVQRSVADPRLSNGGCDAIDN
jgi:hypothetical protein